jgi:hypothetical protein
MNAQPKSTIPSQTLGRLIKRDFKLLSLLEQVRVFSYCLLLYISVILQLYGNFCWAARGACSEVVFN